MIDLKNNPSKERCELCKYYHTLKHDFRTGQGFRMSHACTVWIETKEGGGKCSDNCSVIEIIKALEQIDKIKQIIAIDNSVIQEDVMKYKMICEVIGKEQE